MDDGGHAQRSLCSVMGRRIATPTGKRSPLDEAFPVRGCTRDGRPSLLCAVVPASL